MKNFKNTLIQFTNNGMGSDDESLGQLLAANYIKLLDEESELPAVIAFYNSGVKLICEGSQAIEAFKIVEQRGVKLIACKTCLNHFNLMDKIEVGIAGTMVDIVHFQKVSDKVVSL